MHRITAIIIAMSLILVGLPLAFAQDVGCCCDPLVKNGSLSPRAECTAGFSFIGMPPDIGMSCNEHCQATLAAPGGVCGDGVCQAAEDANSCPDDCAQVVVGCGSPNYNPKPVFTITPVLGNKALKLSYDTACDVDYFTINRCAGDDCTDFETITQTTAPSEFIDKDPTLEFNQDYTYQLIAHYPLAGASEPAIAIGNIGDIECWNRGATPFCVSYTFYDHYQSYLSTYGYGQYTSTDFANLFDESVRQTFATRFNSAWRCTPENTLIETTPALSCDINQDEYCVADETGPRCVVQEECGADSDPFGLYSTSQACETNRYCYFDKSQTVANTCQSCNPRMSCYDYQSRGACERDSCGAGNCQWNPTFDALGLGVCVDVDTRNCEHCTEPRLNTNATSATWSICSETKSQALSTAANQCFFDKDRRISKGCEQVTCADYTRQQCGSPQGGITLAPDNSIATASTDTCNIGVCEYRDATGCVKNADGNTGVGFADCRRGDADCEADYFPPITTIIPQGIAGRVDSLALRVFDQTDSTSPPLDFAGEEGYTTYLCVKTEADDCSNARAFSISTTSDKLLLKNGELKDGQDVVATLDIGQNTLAFFSKDAASNVEEVKEITVTACDACNGPSTLNVSITGGREYKGILHTSASKPTITLTFDEPVDITFAEAQKPGQQVSLSQLTVGRQRVHEFTSPETLDGSYTLTIDAVNEKNIHFDPPGLQYGLVVDPALSGLTIAPADGTIIEQNRVDIELKFSQSVTLDNVSLLLVDYTNPYAKIETPIDITSEFRTNDDQTFTASVDRLEGGQYTLVVDAQGFNQLDVYRQSTFNVKIGEPGILLISPSWGITPLSVFNATIETQYPANCAYVWDTPTPPSPDDFDLYSSFTRNGLEHTSSRFTIPFGADRDYPLHVYCKFGDTIIQRTFNLTIDPDPPRIESAFAEPATIAEEYIPGKSFFVTTLKAQLNKDGFCKYSPATSNYDSMTGTFPGLDLYPKQSHAIDINVTEEKEYQYYVTCKGKNDLTTTPRRVTLDVNLDLPLDVTSSTPPGFDSTTFTLGVVANKRVVCYFGEQPDSVTNCMGACRAKYKHGQSINVQGTGSYNYYVQCVRPDGKKSDLLDIPVVVDTSPPEMTYVDDSSSLPEDPEITWHHNKIRVAVSANDPESNISHYLISLRGQTDRQLVFRDYVSNVTDGEPFYIQTTANGSSFRLINNKRYVFSAVAVNTVGLTSQELESDGVRVDVGQAPEPCYDGEQNNNETDVDCGGSCDACVAGNQCRINEDCETNYCSPEGVCEATSCQDGVKNGHETDVDCGGQSCSACDNTLRCVVNADCLSNYCNLNSHTCEDAPLCKDGQLSPGESDIDCGVVCDTKCGEGKTCNEPEDCAEGLRCDTETYTCTSKPIGDDDNDGIPNDQDECPGTPPTDTPDESGCGLSQTFSLDDNIDDKWRQDHFGCISCPDADADADPDGDGLTNVQEYTQNTDPADRDTDNDGWSDGSEIDKGYDPTNPANFPPSILSTLLFILLGILVLGGLGYGGYLAYRWYQERQTPPETAPRAPTAPAGQRAPSRPAPTKKEELVELRRFAKERELPQEEWIDLEKQIKNKPLAPRTFSHALEGLKNIAGGKKQPEPNLHKLLDNLGKKERDDVVKKYTDLKAGKLSSEEKEKLFKKLRITSDYYKEKKEALDDELKSYGKHSRKK